MAIAIASVATDAHVDDELGGQLLAHVRMLPQGWTDIEPLRQRALDIVVDALRRRTPPVFETDIADVTELRRAVVYGACAKLFEIAITAAGEGQVFALKWEHYERMFRREIESLVITGPEQQRIASRSPSISRR